MSGEICQQDSLTINVNEEEIPSDKPTLGIPTFAIVEKPFKVTGTTPKPNQEVWIELGKFGLDEKIASGVSDSEHKFEMDVRLTKIGFNEIHSEVPSILINPISARKTVLTLNYLIIGGLVLAVLLVLYKQGIIQKAIGGKK